MTKPASRRPSRWSTGTCFIFDGKRCFGFVMQVCEQTKAALRVACLRRLKQQKEEERRRKSRVIWRKLSRLTAFRRAKCVGCYVALPYEVQTWQMIEMMLKQGKRVAVPVAEPKTKRLRLAEVSCPKDELTHRVHGVWQPHPKAVRPVAVRAVDLVLVPGLAFDRCGFRLGHGQGYFDRFLSRLPKDTPTVGLAFRFQLFDYLPVASHDHTVKTVLTA